jgi:D-lactate dehydrogenase
MKAAVFDIQNFERPYFEELGKGVDLTFFDLRLSAHTAPMAKGFRAICIFAHDDLGAPVLEALREGGTQFVALRSAGFNQVDLPKAAELGIKIARVPEYSPYAIAEHATALILALDRKLVRAVARVKELNFSLDGLVGFDLHGKTVGIVGAGRIGAAFARIMAGFGCEVLAHDPVISEELIRVGVKYVQLDELLARSDVVSLHVPLTAASRHIIGDRALSCMKPGAMLINTGRGALIDTKALIKALKSGHVGAAGLDVYEEEDQCFSQDLSGGILQDDVLARLMTFPNVLITAHQAFLTREAIRGIVQTTILNLAQFESGVALTNEVKEPEHPRGNS